MTERRIEHFPLLDGRQLRLTTAEPDHPPRGGIVVVHEARGVTHAVAHLVESLAREGWVTVAPHLYHRDGDDAVVPEGDDSDRDDEAVHARVARLSAGAVVADVDGACEWLAAHGVGADRIGVAGFGLGGTVALLVAARRSLGAAVTVGGLGVVTPLAAGLPPLVDVAPDLRCPWLGIYCRGGDVAEDEVRKLADAADAAQVATDLVYFTEDKCRFDFDQPAAVEAWTRTLNWFDCHLR